MNIFREIGHIILIYNNLKIYQEPQTAHIIIYDHLLYLFKRRKNILKLSYYIDIIIIKTIYVLLALYLLMY